MAPSPAPQPQAPADDEMVRTLGWITVGFVGGLVIVAALTASLIVPDPTVRLRGVLVGCVLALLAWFLPVAAIRRMLASARHGDVPVAATSAAVAVRTAVFVGVANGEAPALVAVVLAVLDGHDIGALLVAAPVAVVSLVLNVSGPGAVRRHLERLRD